MTLRLRSRGLLAAALAVTLLAAICPFASAATDTTPPTGSMEYWAIDNATQLAEFHFAYSDPESGLDHIKFICDGSPDYVVPYAAKVFLPVHDGTAGCSTAYGEHEVLAWVVNGAGLESAQQYAYVTNGPIVTVKVSPSPTTGHPITLTPVFPSDYAIPAGSACSWEFRWGTTDELDHAFTGSSFGGMYFVTPASAGGCGPWTFTLPWVPVRQFDLVFQLGTPYVGSEIAFGARDQIRFTAAEDSTDRRILSSNLPIAQVLPSTYTPIVGQPITYTRYLIGGETGCCNARWSARLGDGEQPLVWEQAGGATFTFTPPVPGDVLVEWHREATNGLLLDTYYDPPVRTRDTTRPTTTAPAQRVRPMAAGDTIPIAVTWTGADKGWGVKSYQLQRSVNGGTWAYVHLPTATTKSIGVTGAPGTTVRFRVRAIDQAGNYGFWTYGPTFAVQRLADGSSASRYAAGAWSVVANGNALNGSLHATTKAGAATSITVTGRDVGWIAERGPGHGKAKVYVDGVYVATIDLLASAAQPRTIVFARHWSSVGTHVVRIVNQATTGRPLIDVDGVAVLH